jgi:hypothetical protein
VFALSNDNFCRIKSTGFFYTVCNILLARTSKLCYLFDSGSPQC